MLRNEIGYVEYEAKNVNKRCVYVNRSKAKNEKRSVLFLIQNGLSIKAIVCENENLAFFFYRY